MLIGLLEQIHGFTIKFFHRVEEQSNENNNANGFCCLQLLKIDETVPVVAHENDNHFGDNNHYFKYSHRIEVFCILWA